jgi:hypothetical protein
MVPLRAALVSDLNPGDWVTIRCSCGHQTFLPPYLLVEGLRVGPQDRVTDVAGRLPCRACDGTGNASVSIRWLGADRRNQTSGSGCLDGEG